jgi:hypothetical protein
LGLSRLIRAATHGTCLQSATSISSPTTSVPLRAEIAHLPDDRIRVPVLRPRQECFGATAQPRKTVMIA